MKDAFLLSVLRTWRRWQKLNHWKWTSKTPQVEFLWRLYTDVKIDHDDIEAVLESAARTGT